MQKKADVTIKPDSAPAAVQAPEQIAVNLLRAFELGGQILAKVLEDKDKRATAFTVMSGLTEAGKLFSPIIQHWMTSDPQGFAVAQTKLAQELIELWGLTYKRYLGE
ncbi:MAG TPA: hypothetical protein VE986_07600, partial [Hyphomicrobiales bacterium]|nr:hypothetical protein [Hyphomicrobiales bacterium]